jgi:hypothetical protein
MKTPKRQKRTIYLMPDLAERVDETAAVGGVTPSAIVETALDEHFTRESVYGAVEVLTRRFGDLDDRVAAQNAVLTKIDTAIGAIGRALVVIQGALKQSQPAEQPPQPAAQERPLEPEGAGRAGWLGLGRRQ